MKEPLLSIRGVSAGYGEIVALHGVDLDIGEGEIVALIGSNGAGKTTLMMTVFGDPRARSGTIAFAGEDITHAPTHEIARRPIAQASALRTPATRRSVCTSSNTLKRL